MLWFSCDSGKFRTANEVMCAEQAGRTLGVARLRRDVNRREALMPAPGCRGSMEDEAGEVDGTG